MVFKTKTIKMKYKSLIIISCIGLLSITVTNAQTKPQHSDSLKREDSLRRDRAARADVYVSGKNILTHEPTKVDSAVTIKKAEVQRKRKGCRKIRQ